MVSEKICYGNDAKHDLDYDRIDELDDVSGSQQQALIWCNAHKKFEWHWIDRNRALSGWQRRD